MPDLRPMAARDVEPCELVWDVAYRTMRERHALPVIPRNEESARWMRARMHHLLGTDPDGAVVATVDGLVIGFAQSFVREDLWVLSLFAVAPEAQGRGIGRALLDASLTNRGDRAGMILVSRDPLAMRRYFAAGFDLYPAVVAWGAVRHDRLPVVTSVRDGDEHDFQLAAGVDRAVRGAAHGPDLGFLIGQGSQLLVHDDGGYALAGRRPVLVAATTEAVARELLAAVLRRIPEGDNAELGWITGAQQWAIAVALDAGLELHPMGPMGLRGFDRPPAPYVPTGAFG